MVGKKTIKNAATKAKSTKAKSTRSKTGKTKSKSVKSKNKHKNDYFDDAGIVIVDDDIEIDKEKVNEERRAYLEEARSQEASD